MNDFTVTLLADSSNHSFDINHAIDFEKYPYEVCMQEIILQPNSWVNIITGGGKYHVVYVVKNGSYRTVVDFKLNSGIYINTIQFVDTVNKSIFDALQRCEKEDKSTAISQFTTIPTQFITAKNVNEYIMNLPQDHYIVFDEILSYLFGITTSIYSYQLVSIYNNFLFNESIDFSRFLLTILWVFGNFVSPTILGSFQQPLLGMIPLDLSSTDVNYKILPKVYYYNVQRRRIKNFCITICSDFNGNVLNMLQPYQITLHFKPIYPLYYLHGFPLIVHINESQVQLNSTLNFSESAYEVCIRDIWFSYEGWPNITPGNNEIYIRNSYDDVYLGKVEALPGYYKTRSAFLGAIATSLIQWHTKQHDTRKHKISKMITFRDVFDLQNKNYIFKPKIDIYINAHMLYTLGLISHINAIPIAIKPNEVINMDKIDISRITIKNLCIYADFIDESIIACQQDALLKSIPNISYVNRYEYASDFDKYRRVQKRYVNTLGFKFKDSLESEYYLHPTCSITIGLYFKEV